MGKRYECQVHSQAQKGAARRPFSTMQSLCRVGAVGWQRGGALASAATRAPAARAYAAALAPARAFPASLALSSARSRCSSGLSLSKLVAPPQLSRSSSSGVGAGPAARPPPTAATPAAGSSKAAPPAESAGGTAAAGQGIPGEPGPHVPFSLRNFPAWWRANNARLKYFFRTYGYFAVATYLGVYVITLAGLFGLVRAGAIRGPDVNTWLNNWSVKKAFTDKPVHLSPVATDFGVAWLLTKTTEPVRLVVTLAILPVLARRVPASVARLFRFPPHATTTQK
jgi:hypothetical protein